MPQDAPETPAPVIRPTQWERIGFGANPSLLGWTWRQVRLAGLHLNRLAKNPMTWKVIGGVAGVCLFLIGAWAEVTKADRQGTAQCESWADRYGMKVAWDKDLDMCLGTRKSVLGNGNVWQQRPFFIQTTTGKLVWVQSNKNEDPPSVSPSEEEQCWDWASVLKTDLTWNAGIKRCIGYRTYTPPQVGSGIPQGSSWVRPYRVNTTSGKRSWLERPY